jgi:N-acetylglucosamine-6-phosphate deacetylase
MLHATAVFEVSVTDALNCCVVPVGTEALVGLTVTAITGTTVTLAEADLAGSATLVAITLTLAGEGGTGGAK